MKKVEAVIRPFKVDDVKRALTALGIGGMTVTDVRGVGHEPERTATYGEARYTIDLPPKAKIDVAVPDYLADSLVNSSTGL
jgi:nitrogen regulatory protein P-II 1